MVVGVDHLSDAQGGLQHTRYCVRACHNGLLHRCEAADSAIAVRHGIGLSSAPARGVAVVNVSIVSWLIYAV